MRHLQSPQSEPPSTPSPNAQKFLRTSPRAAPAPAISQQPTALKELTPRAEFLAIPPACGTLTLVTVVAARLRPPVLQNIFQLLTQFRGDARVLPASRDGDLDMAALHPRRHYKMAFLRGIGDVGEYAFALGGDADAMVGPAVVGGGEHQHVVA